MCAPGMLADVHHNPAKPGLGVLPLTTGSMAPQVLSHPDVDATRTVSNHLVEIIDVLGIEAARLALLREMRGVIEFDGSCAPVLPRCAVASVPC